MIRYFDLFCSVGRSVGYCSSICALSSNQNALATCRPITSRIPFTNSTIHPLMFDVFRWFSTFDLVWISVGRLVGSFVYNVSIGRQINKKMSSFGLFGFIPETNWCVYGSMLVSFKINLSSKITVTEKALNESKQRLIKHHKLWIFNSFSWIMK